MSQAIQTFEDLDAMSVRQSLGRLLDNVGKNNTRYIVMRKGKAKALLVPLEDKSIIEKSVATKEQDQLYSALGKMNGMVTDQVTDTSEKIDEILYGETGQGENA